ncbi:MAG: uracil-DNA glycosylase [Acidobacteriota bacterium]
MRNQTHISGLNTYVAELRKRDAVEVPEFDPLDGGDKAQVLFLFQKPGPKAAQSGFISRNNDDSTAAAILAFMKQADIPRKLTVIWNVIPWWNGTVDITANELKDGLKCLEGLVRLLPELRAVMMVGLKATAARSYLEERAWQIRKPELLSSDHPGPKVKARWPERWKAIPSKWAEVCKYVETGR